MSRPSLLFVGCPISFIPPARWRAKVNHITDGDTLWVEVDCGFRTTHLIELRVVGPDGKGFNAPERFTPEGKLSTEFVQQYCPEGSWVALIAAPDTEKYGRWLATVWNESLLLDLATEMVQAKLGEWKQY